MGNVRKITSIIKADFKERTRNYGFLLVVGMSIISAFLFVPLQESKFAVVEISGFRGIYNSAWVGSSVAMSTVTILFLLGFFYVKSAINLDRKTGVGQIIATTPISKGMYLIGKFLSNFSILGVLVVFTYVISIVMQLVRKESLILDFAHLTLPFIIVVLPVIVVVAAAAVMFESIDFLKGGFGNIVYFFIWGSLLKYETVSTISFGRFDIRFNSLMGSEIFKNSMSEKFTLLFPGYSAKISEGLMFMDKPLKTFIWEGVSWNLGIAAGRIIWIALAIFLVLVASFLFKGFEIQQQKKNQSALYRFFNLFSRQAKIVNDNHLEFINNRAEHLAPVSYKPRFINRLILELKLSLSHQKWWWYLVQFALVISCLVIPLETVKKIVGPLLWCWPLLVWSSMGTREAKYNIQQVVFSCPFPIRKNLISLWISGWIITVLTGSGLLIRLIIEKELLGVLAWLVGTMFIPSLALALGVWTRTSRTFEVVFMIFMFLGVFNQVTILDFMGVVEGSISSGITVIYAIITIILFLLSVYGRKRQIIQ